MASDEVTHHVYKVVYREDGHAEFSMSQAHKAMLIFLVGNAGETVMDWDAAEQRRTAEMEKRKESIKVHMSHLVRLGLITEIALVGSSRVLIRLTDMGRNIAAQLMGHAS